MANSLHSMCFVGRAEGAGIFAKAGQSIQNPEEGQPPAEPAASDLLWKAWDNAGKSFPVVGRGERNGPMTR